MEAETFLDMIMGKVGDTAKRHGLDAGCLQAVITLEADGSGGLKIWYPDHHRGFYHLYFENFSDMIDEFEDRP